MIEIRARDSATGEPMTLTLSDAGVDAEEIE